MGRMSLETRAKVIGMRNKGFEVHQIWKHLEDEGVCVSKVALHMLLKKYATSRTIQDLKRRLRPQLLNENQYRFIDNTMADNVDMTARQLHSAFISEYPCLLYTSPSPRDATLSRMPSSA